MRGKIEQGLVEHLMVLRAQIAFKNNLRARIKTSREINEKLDEVKKKYLKSVQQGKLPAAPVEVNAGDD